MITDFRVVSVQLLSTTCGRAYSYIDCFCRNVDVQLVDIGLVGTQRTFQITSLACISLVEAGERYWHVSNYSVDTCRDTLDLCTE